MEVEVGVTKQCPRRLYFELDFEFFFIIFKYQYHVAQKALVYKSHAYDRIVAVPFHYFWDNRECLNILSDIIFSLTYID